jgi:RNA polymerase sigma-70 factor (ECF subfamily)
MDHPDLLTERLRRGDESAFALLLDTWSPSMLRLARSFVSTGASAEEVVQESWLAVYRGISAFEGRSSLRTWVFRILVNTAKKRGIAESRTIPFGSLFAEDEGAATDPSRLRPVRGVFAEHSDRGSEPEDAAERAEILRVVEQAMTGLPERTRAVLALRDMQGYTSQEVCALLRISPGNQRVLLHRARAVVRGRLAAYLDTDIICPAPSCDAA